MRRAAAAIGLCLLLAAGCRKPAPGPKLIPSTQPAPPATSDPEAWRSAVPAPGAPGHLDIPAPATQALANGLRIFVLRRPGGVVSMSVVVRHGAGSTGEGKSGLAALTARMLTEGTRRRSSLELAEAAETLGSTLSHDAGRDYSSVGMTVLREDVERGLVLMAVVVKEPAFDAKELERVRAEWIEHLKDERQDPQRLASLAGLRLLLGPVLGAPVQGSIPDVKRLGVRELREFYARAYTPANAALVVVGDVSPEHVREAAQRFLGSWRGREWTAEAASTAADVPRPRRVVIVDRADAVQSAIFAAQPFPPRMAPGHEAREILGTLFGGLFTSRVNQNLREEHAYTYGANARAVATRHWGAFVVSTTVEAEATAAALEEIWKELRLVRGGDGGEAVLDEEVSRAQAALVSAVGEHLETSAGIGADLAEIFYAGLPNDYYARYGELIRAVTRDDVQREATQRLDPEHSVVVVVGDRAKLDAPLRATGASVESAAPSLVE